MAEQTLDTVTVTGSKKGAATLDNVYRVAAATLGLDPDSEETKAKISKQIEELEVLHPEAKTDEQLAQVARSNVPRLISGLIKPMPSDVNAREQQDFARNRDVLSKQVEQRADVTRRFAPFTTNVRDTLGGSTGERAKQMVESEYAPLRAFDAQAKAQKEARTADQDAMGKQYENQKKQAEALNDRAKALGVNLDLFNRQLDNDPTSQVSKVAVQAASQFLQKFGAKVPPNLANMSKYQVDVVMGDIIKTALANAKTEAERQNILAAAKLSDKQAELVGHQARVEAVDAHISEQVGGQRGMQVPGAAQPGTGTPGAPQAPRAPQPGVPGAVGAVAGLPQATTTPGAPAVAPTGAAPMGNAPLPAKWATKYNTPFETAQQAQEAKQATDFQGGARGRDRLKVAINDARALLKTAKPGMLGPVRARYETKMQELAKSLATIMEENGVAGADTNYKAMISASTGADISKQAGTIEHILDNVEAQTAKDEFIGEKRNEAQGRPFNEGAMRNGLVTIKLTHPKTGDTQIQVIDMTTTSRQELEAFREKYKAFNPKPIGGR